MRFLRSSPATAALLAAIAAGYVLEILRGGSTNPAVLVALGANVPDLVRAGQWWRVATSIFLHIGIVHLLLNSWALYQMGALLERFAGAWRMLLVFFASGIAGALASVAWDRADLSAGASGGVFGVLGAIVALLVRRRDRLAPQGQALLTQLVSVAAINVVLGLSTPGIDNAAHFGGALAGLAIGWGLRSLSDKRADKIARWPRAIN